MPVSIMVVWDGTRVVRNAGGGITLQMDGIGFQGNVELEAGKDYNPAIFDVHGGGVHDEVMRTSMAGVTVERSNIQICQNKVVNRGDLLTIKKLLIKYIDK